MNHASTVCCCSHSAEVVGKVTRLVTEETVFKQAANRRMTCLEFLEEALKIASSRATKILPTANMQAHRGGMLNASPMMSTSFQSPVVFKKEHDAISVGSGASRVSWGSGGSRKEKPSLKKDGRFNTVMRCVVCLSPPEQVTGELYKEGGPVGGLLDDCGSQY